MAKSNDIAISTLQVQVDDVKTVMTQNIEKVLEREERLSELADRSDDLETAFQAHGFQKTTIKISKKMWWKNTKMIIIIAIIFIIVVIFIVLIATGVIPM
ncbi:vesicle-associated membrane protein 8 [Notechis scutatus]|uniref:Vesicle-associated membrane protein 8 n=1 Tax=Notechis scutatus TaxID=8663 RepID=A0A6J1UMZ4_9SAUR|nr:vesicle-associated membrane protein 8 [Notechis scutatus]